MDQSRNLEDHLRNLLHQSMHSGPPPLQDAVQYPAPPQMPPYSQIPPPHSPPDFAMAPPSLHQHHGVPNERQQGFNHFLQQHHVSMPGPAHQTNPGFHNNIRNNHGPPQRNFHPMDPNDFHRPRPASNPHHGSHSGPHSGSYSGPHSGPQSGPRSGPRSGPHSGPHHGPPRPQQKHQLFQPQTRPSDPQGFFDRQWQYLAQVADQEILRVQMRQDEIDSKDAFRATLQSIFENLQAADPEKPLPSVMLQSFGSLSSGFATTGSDMDLAIITSSDERVNEHFSSHEHGLPRVLEKELLNKGFGARLLTRTRVPIIKICEKPTPELLEALRVSRAEWDNLSADQKVAPHNASKGQSANAHPGVDETRAEVHGTGNNTLPGVTSTDQGTIRDPSDGVSTLVKSTETLHIDQDSQKSAPQGQPLKPISNDEQPNQERQANRQRNDRHWRREKAVGPLDFPKQGVGIQCDINFFNPLGVHNTKMLRCYAKCDPRVKPMVLFIKAWAKRRKINSSYSGTLSSYGYVLMVLHYLVNVARPPVLPNLQHEAEASNIPSSTIDGFEVRFFDDEEAIEDRARQGTGTQNHEPLGMLLCGFFQYYAQTRNGYGFIWTQDVLSLRTQGGVLSKQEKGWTGAKTEIGENREVRHRYLFAIEDPFEVSHNVARTVTHNGICAIRDEFRRAWRIITAVGRGYPPHDGGLFDELVEVEEPATVPAPAAPPAVQKKPQEYSNQFPSLGGASQNPISVAEQAPSPPAVDSVRPADPVHASPSVSAPVHATTQSAPVSTPATRGKGRRQKFVPLNMGASGEINGDRARAHLDQYRRSKQSGQGAPHN